MNKLQIWVLIDHASEIQSSKYYKAKHFTWNVNITLFKSTDTRIFQSLHSFGLYIGFVWSCVFPLKFFMLRPGTLELMMKMDDLQFLVDFKIQFPILTPHWKKILAEFQTA